MRWTCFISLLLVATVSAQTTTPADAARSAQVAAAATDAVAGLFQQVESVVLGGSGTAGDLIKAAKAEAAILSTLGQARQVGGPRWLDESTAQVRLEISGQPVAQKLEAILTEANTKLPITLEQARPALSILSSRNFTASGSSAAASVIGDVEPADSDRTWANVDPAVRKAVIAAARHKASEQVIDRLSEIALPDGRTIGTVVDDNDGTVRAALEAYLLQRPVTGVQFRDDQQVEVTLSAPPAQTLEVLREALASAPAGVSLDAAAWETIADQFLHGSSAATGLGQLPQDSAMLPLPVSVQLPDQPPLWAGHMLDTSAEAEGESTRLKTRHAAEQLAVAELRRQVLELPLTPDLKLGDAASRDPDIAAAVDRALARSRAYKSDYFPDGRVVVKASIDLREVWQQLQDR